MTPLHTAILKNNIEIVKLLLLHSNADINQRMTVSIIIFNIIYNTDIIF